jgi:DNA-binding transcriptional ArsR family regulator
MSVPVREKLVLDRPEQLKALGHPLRVRALELLCQHEDAPLTNRELAARLGVDPGHLHFHVRMLLKAGLIELAEGGRGREKPYRASARSIEVHPELLASGGATGVQEAMLDDVRRSLAAYGSEGRVRTVQAALRVPAERLLELVNSALDAAEAEEEQGTEIIVVTAFVAPPVPAAE